MRKLVHAAVVTVLAVAAFACKRPGSQKLEGHWKGFKAEGVDPSAQISASAFANSTEIIAQGNQVQIQTQAGRTPPAIYVVDKEDATTLVIHTDKDPTAETFTFDEKGQIMVWRIDAQRTISFKRVP